MAKNGSRPLTTENAALLEKLWAEYDAAHPETPERTAARQDPVEPPPDDQLRVPKLEIAEGKKMERTENTEEKTAGFFTGERFALQPAFTAYQPQPPTEWLVEGLLSKGSVNLLVGEGGSKKTYAMLDMAVCLAQGLGWLNFTTRQANVVWVDEESGSNRMKKRLSQVMSAHQSPPELPFYFTSLAMYNLRTAEHVGQLMLKAWEVEAGLIVIDALADVMPGADENMVRDVVPVFQGLRKVADQTGAAVVVIHHANKSGGYRGSTSMHGAVELMLQVHSKKNTTFIEFQSVKTRDTGMVNFAAQIHFEPGEGEAERVRLSPAHPTEAQKAIRRGEPISRAGRYVLEYLRDNGESGLKEMVEETDKFSKNYLKKALIELKDSGLIGRTNEGGKGVTAIYDLTEDAEEYV
jgi:hypothetical protein